MDKVGTWQSVFLDSLNSFSCLDKLESGDMATTAEVVATPAAVEATASQGLATAGDGRDADNDDVDDEDDDDDDDDVDDDEDDDVEGWHLSSSFIDLGMAANGRSVGGRQSIDGERAVMAGDERARGRAIERRTRLHLTAHRTQRNKAGIVFGTCAFRLFSYGRLDDKKHTHTNHERRERRIYGAINGTLTVVFVVRPGIGRPRYHLGVDGPWIDAEIGRARAI